MNNGVEKLNAENPLGVVADPAFGTLVDRFIEEERLLEIRRQGVGETVIEGLQFSTACSYMTILERHIRPRWGTTDLSRVRPIHIQEWLKQLNTAPRYKSNIKALMHRLFEKAMLWELIEVQRKPLELVEIRGISKRRKKPFVLTLEQYYAVLAELPEPYRTMVIVAQCLGLRVSEILALKWSDIDFESLTMRVTRKVVNGRVSCVKTEYSEDDLPLDPDFGRELLRWKNQCPASFEGWVFPGPLTVRPYYASEIQKDYIKLAGERLGLVQNGEKVSLGWHSFRHTYRSLLDASGAPIGVQQKVDAARAGGDHHGCVRHRAHGIQARGQQQGCSHGAPALGVTTISNGGKAKRSALVTARREGSQNQNQNYGGVLWGWSPVIGCGGLQHTEAARPSV